MGDISAIRPTPTASGTLAKTPLIHLLLYVLNNGLSGTVELRVPGSRSALVQFLGGKPAKAWISDTACYLGQVLCELGHLSPTDLARSLDELAAAKSQGQALHGQMLLASGKIDEEKLDAALREQVARKLSHAASLPPETTYAYYDLFDGLAGWGPAVKEGFDPLPMLWEMLRRNPMASHVDAALSKMHGLPLRLSANANVARLGLIADHQAVVQRLRERPQRLHDIPKASGLAEPDARLLIYLLLVTKQLDVLRPTDSAIAATVGAVAPNIPAPNMPVAPRFTPTENLAVARPAPDAVAVAIADPTLPPELRERWDEVVQRAATVDRADYFSMLGLQRDATKDSIDSAFLALAKKWHPDRIPPELAPIRDACSRVFARMSEARATLTDEHQRADYMRLLADGSGSPETQEQVAKVIEAATNFQKAEVCLRRGDHAQAETLCAKALEADPTQPDYIAMLAWLLQLKPENQTPEGVKVSLDMLDRAVSMSNRCEKAFFWRGMLRQRMGRTAAAVRDFKRASELNPRNIDAAREVRLYRMRGGRSTSPPGAATGGASGGKPSPLPAKPEAPKPGLLNRLFKK
jgi:tetratricopeptide (TPR) repeat protein